MGAAAAKGKGIEAWDTARTRSGEVMRHNLGGWGEGLESGSSIWVAEMGKRHGNREGASKDLHLGLQRLFA